MVLACAEPINERDFLEKLFDSNARACNDGCLLLNRVAPDFGVVGLWESDVAHGESITTASRNSRAKADGS